MAVITDRDLLVREPSLFVNGAAGATLLRDTTDGSVSGTSLTSASSDFTTLGVDLGHVVVLSDVACEVAGRVSATQLNVSLPRSLITDPLVGPAAGANQRMIIPTFKRLIDLAEAWALGALGIDADDPLQPLTTADIVDLESLKHVIAMRTIQQGFAISAALNPASAALKEQASLYGERLAEAKDHVKVLVKLDGDSQADSTRRMDAITFVRQ
jgi:hypothetical protein